jgi:hypothetical protein
VRRGFSEPFDESDEVAARGDHDGAGTERRIADAVVQLASEIAAGAVAVNAEGKG